MASKMAAESARTQRLNERNRRQREKANLDSRLLRLPPELRNRIFSFALPSDKMFTTAGFAQTIPDSGNGEDDGDICLSVRTPEDFIHTFNITQVCRQIRSETLKVAYASNLFILHVRRPYARGANATEWIESRPSEVLSCITKVVLSLGLANAWETCGCVVNIFDLDSETVRTFRTGCDPCHQIKEENVVSEYGMLAKRDSSSSMTPKERLSNLVAEARRIADSLSRWP
ncbi:hypothetical protein PRZ48_009500 [Zasmidium cellare]|uniref:F-box domain-containing protein n=1 Tax=Zasmidium cellare TaxID=395010 RepID=A0ABR0EC97_ZASCE|nr:hypothetical protein PRZ48_009500 [Zasmidium cellare]